jgi:CheY-like chemotaxis protein
MTEERPDAIATVLVVDDDPWILELVKDMLAAEPCRVVTTTEALKALPLMEWERADVIVADIAMPEVEGVDLIVRAFKLFPDVPRILLTAAPTLERIIRSVNEAEVYRVRRCCARPSARPFAIASNAGPWRRSPDPGSGSRSSRSWRRTTPVWARCRSRRASTCSRRTG